MVRERNETDARIAKLPKWAAEYIRILEMRLTEERNHIHRLQQPVTGETRSVVDPYSSHPAALHGKARVRYYIGQHDSIDVSRVNGGDELEVYYAGMGTVAVVPQAGNVLTLRVVKR